MKISRLGHHLVTPGWILVLSLPVAAAESQDAPATVAERYAALLKEYHVTSREFRAAENDLQRKRAVEHLNEFAPRFLDLADKNPRDPAALQALRQAIQVINSTDSLAQQAWEISRADFPAGSTDGFVKRAVALSLRDHLGSSAVSGVCERARWGYRLEYEGFLRKVLEANPHREVQAVACLGLAQFLSDRLLMLQLVDERPELEQRYQVLFGDRYLPQLRQRERAGLSREAEELYERAAADYADVKIPEGGTVGERARKDLFGMRHLAIGKPAPDLAGTDQDGTKLKLSNYRGKVVLLNFWSEY